MDLTMDPVDLAMEPLSPSSARLLELLEPDDYDFPGGPLRGKGLPPRAVAAAEQRAQLAEQRAQLEEQRCREAAAEALEARGRQQAAELQLAAVHQQHAAVAAGAAVAAARAEAAEAELDRLQHCVVCFHGERTVLIKSCGHVGLCGTCALTLLAAPRNKQCPFCRTRFTKKDVLFGIKLP